jgi:hypothetical protein
MSALRRRTLVHLQGELSAGESFSRLVLEPLCEYGIRLIGKYAAEQRHMVERGRSWLRVAIEVP